MPKNPEIKKVLMIGSGPIVIGQAAEFDYAGTQACRSLKEEGVEVVLLNSNPATIMTDKDIADKVYQLLWKDFRTTFPSKTKRSRNYSLEEAVRTLLKDIDVVNFPKYNTASIII